MTYSQAPDGTHVIVNSSNSANSEAEAKKNRGNHIRLSYKQSAHKWVGILDRYRYLTV